MRTGLLISGGAILQQASQFLFGLMVARALGPTEYGYFSVGRNSLLWAATFAPLGLDLAMIRYAAQYGADPRFWRTLSSLRTIVVLISIATTILIASLSGLVLRLNTSLVVVMVASIAALPFAADSSVLMGYFRARGHPLLFSMVFDYGQSCGRFLLSGLLFALGTSAAVFALANTTLALVGAVAVGAVAIWIRPKDAGQRTVSELPSVRAILNVSPWLAFSSVCYGLFRVLDLAVLAGWVPTDELGRYAAITTLAALVQVYPLTIAIGLGPQVAKILLAEGPNSAAGPIRSFVSRASLAGGYVYGGTAIFGQHLNIFFGEAFHVDRLSLIALSTAWLLSGVLNPTGLALWMTGQHRREGLLTLAGVLIYVLTLLALVPLLGSRGAALSLLIAMILIQASRVLLVGTRIKGAIVSLWDLLPPLFALTIAGAIDGTISLTYAPSWATFLLEGTTYTIVFGLAALRFNSFRSKFR